MNSLISEATLKAEIEKDNALAAFDEYCANEGKKDTLEGLFLIMDVERTLQTWLLLSMKDLHNVKISAQSMIVEFVNASLKVQSEALDEALRITREHVDSLTKTIAEMKVTLKESNQRAKVACMLINELASS